jgi:hypothetical protein
VVVFGPEQQRVDYGRARLTRTGVIDTRGLGGLKCLAPSTTVKRCRATCSVIGAGVVIGARVGRLDGAR